MKTKPMNIYNYEPGSFEDDFYNRLAEKGILEYGTADYFPEQGGIQTLLSKLKENPIVQAGLTAINPLGTLLTNLAKGLPVNERAIQEKALRQMGYSIDDIGRIVQGSGDYLTPENVMAGYAASQMTPETFDKRIESILNRSLPQTAASAAKIKAIQEAKQDFLDAQKLTEIRKEAEFKSKNAEALAKQKAIEDAAKAKRDIQQYTSGGGGGGGGGGGESSGGSKGSGGESKYGGFCFDPNTPIQMADGSEKKIKDIQLGDDTKGGEVTGVFQFKASDEIHDYKGVTVAGSHYVKEDGKFIMVKDSPLSVKIDKIPVVYSLDTTGRRIFINNIEFADYNGDGIAKGFLENAGVDLAGFDKEVLRQVEHRLI